VPFDDVAQRDIRRRAHGTCECVESSCPHFGRCRVAGKEYHHKKPTTAGGTNDVHNGLYLCGPCHERHHKSAGNVSRL